MASIHKFFGLRHLRSDPTAHVLHFRGGELARDGRGLSFWFLPLSASVSEVPCDDRDETFLFHSRSRDFQDVTAQGVITYRVIEPQTVASRIDFSIDLSLGLYKESPLEQLSQLLIQAAQQHAWDYLASTPVRDLLADGVERVRTRIVDGLRGDPCLQSLGIEVVSVRVSRVAPTSELEKALQAPTNESIQQEADEAMFQRRALAVEKERAIQENELQNRIELARKNEQLIVQDGQNDQRRALEAVEAGRIEAEGEAERRRLDSQVRADGIRTVEEANVAAERERMDIYRTLPTGVLLGMAAQELATKLEKIEHLNVAPELFGPILTDLVRAGTRHLNGDGDGSDVAAS